MPDPQEFGQAITGLNRKFAEDAAQRKAAAWQLPYFDLGGFPIDEDALQTLTQEEAAVARAVVFFRDRDSAKVGAVDPKSPALLRLLKSRFAKNPPELYLISEAGLREALAQYRKKSLTAPLLASREITVPGGPDLPGRLRALPQNEAGLLAMPMTDLLGLLIGAAISLRASDIHIEPEKKTVKLRYRIDGVLQEIASFPVTLLPPLISRVKYLSGLKFNVTNTPQDGRLTVKPAREALALRVSVLPTAFGESVVIRILGMREVGLEIEHIGLAGRALEVIKKELRKPNGMILTTGPTGSGKTTTLYAFLNHLNKPGVKIITLEDPVEYELEGISQTPIDHRAGMDFAKGLRSILRQDPDIIMVGEIRDFETAETACQAALTGHVVLYTLHTNDAAGAIPRLLDLGVKPVTVAPALNALIAQRLVRRLCEHCKESYRPAAQELRRVKDAPARIPKEAEVKIPETLSFFRGKGCEECHHLGYHGRVGVFEIFSVDDAMEKMIYQQASTVDIKRAAVAQGMMSMQQDGVLKALQGITDLSEVWRVTEE